MLSLARIIIYLLEGFAITIAIFLITKKRLQTAELFTLALTIGVTFMVLDLFSPQIAAGARQGAGFGLGFKQVGGAQPSDDPEGYPSGVSCSGGQCNLATIEGMDDPVAIQYYKQYNPLYEASNFPPPLNTYEMTRPRAPEYDQAQPQNQTNQMPESFSDYQTQPQQPQQPQAPKAQSQISKKLRQNPFETIVRSVSEIDTNGASYGPDGPYSPDEPDADASALREVQPSPLLYNPRLPTYGFRYQLPKGWDELEQKDLYKAFNKFRNTSPDSQDCQTTLTGDQAQYNANYQYEKKNN